MSWAFIQWTFSGELMATEFTAKELLLFVGSPLIISHAPGLQKPYGDRRRKGILIKSLNEPPPRPPAVLPGICAPPVLLQSPQLFTPQHP